MDDGGATAQDTIRSCAATGRVVTFGPLSAGRVLPTYEDDDVWAGRSIDGTWLSAFLMDQASSIHGRGVTITGARIIGGLDLEGVALRGALKLIRCQLGPHRVNLTEATARSIALTGSACGGLDADGLQSLGNVLLDDGFTATAGVRLRGSTIGGSLDCRAGTFTDPDGIALDAGRAQITGDVHLRNGFASAGEVRLPGAIIGGNLHCGGGIFVNADGLALEADRAQITGDLYLTDNFTSEGTVRLRGATISGSFTCLRARLARPGGTALSAHQVSVGRNVYMGTGFQSVGGVNLMLSTIGGDLDCTDGSFSNPGGYALTVPHSRIARSVWLNGAFEADGTVALVGSKIGNDLELDGGTLVGDRWALRAERVEVGGAVSFRDGFTAKGGVCLTGSSIGRQLDCSGGRFSRPGSVALEAEASQIGGEVFLRDGFVVEGAVSFVRACAGALVDDEAAWPERFDLDGFRYERLHSPARGWKDRARWLRRQPTPSPHAYVHLATVYRASGDDHDARKILIERHNAMLRPPSHWARDPRRLRRLWLWVLRFTIGHGYEPWRVLAVTIPLVLGMSLWYGLAAEHDVLTPTTGTARASSCDGDHTCVQPVVYALDTLVPLVGFEQRSQWRPDQSRRSANPLLDGRWLAAATWTTTAAGWAIATLVTAGFTQLIRRE